MAVSEKSLQKLRNFLATSTSIKIKYRYLSLESFHGKTKKKLKLFLYWHYFLNIINITTCTYIYLFVEYANQLEQAEFYEEHSETLLLFVFECYLVMIGKSWVIDRESSRKTIGGDEIKQSGVSLNVNVNVNVNENENENQLKKRRGRPKKKSQDDIPNSEWKKIYN